MTNCVCLTLPLRSGDGLVTEGNVGRPKRGRGRPRSIAVRRCRQSQHGLAIRYWPVGARLLKLGSMTESLPRPEVIITHESDLDGLVSGVLLQRLARKLFKIEVRLEACNYHYWRQRDLRERSGWITDLAFEQRHDKANWVIIDHHAVEIPAKNALLIHDLNKSA